MVKKDTVAIVGLGKVGTAVGFLLRKAGYEITAATSRTESSFARAAAYTGVTTVTEPANIAARATTILITTTDDNIVAVCREIAEGGDLGPGKKIIHMSGAAGTGILESAKKRGAKVGSIHPIQTFADIDSAIKKIPGSWFGITVDDELRTWASGLVRDLAGIPFFVSENDRPVYHAAACISSNYLVSLIRLVERMYMGVGLGKDDALKAFLPLVKGTLSNIEERGSTASLTGPIARGDSGTVAKHLEAISRQHPDLLEFYRLMGKFTVDTGVEKGSISAEKAEEIRTLLEGGKK